MNFTEVFIRRPVMTVLLNIAIVMAGATFRWLRCHATTRR
jgi:multidrug efflux pump subunit AcrB